VILEDFKRSDMLLLKGCQIFSRSLNCALFIDRYSE